MTKTFSKFALSIAVGTIFWVGFPLISQVSAAETVEKEQSSLTVSSEKISPYVLEMKAEPTIYNREGTADPETTTVVRIDFTDAEFYDESGNLVDKESVMETIVPAPSVRSAGTSGGTWQTGSGYAVCKGMTVTGQAGKVGLTVKYKVDFQNNQGVYDRLDRVYGATADGLGTWTWLSNGVLRANETAGYSAYGGVKGQWTVTPGLGLPPGTSTKYLYFRVGNDTFWLDHNL